jgi:asparagine synthase (glutamine-hydrolysing)
MLENHVGPVGFFMEELVLNLAKAISASVQESVSDEKNVGVMFSGGIDSTLVGFLAKKINPNTKLYTIGTEKSQDLESARKTAKEIDCELIERVLSEQDILSSYWEVSRILGTTELLPVELGIPILVCSDTASGGGVNTLLSGHGADELFGGYDRYPRRFASGEDVEKMMADDLRKVIEVDTKSAERIAGESEVKVLFPFLAKGVVEEAQKIPIEEHFLETPIRKPILRKIALSLGLPKSASSRPKKAFQYGSGIHRIVLGYARKNELPR